ncbi:MAG: hypothetical protein HYY09_00680 [Firmicutes bacterium]|nr:hypothetical protein [Bacillota bacterium]
MTGQRMDRLALHGIELAYPERWHLVFEERNPRWDRGQVGIHGLEAQAFISLVWDRPQGLLNGSLEDHVTRVLGQMGRRLRGFNLLSRQEATHREHPAFLSEVVFAVGGGFLRGSPRPVQRLQMMLVCPVSGRFFALHGTATRNAFEEWRTVFEKVLHSLVCHQGAAD